MRFKPRNKPAELPEPQGVQLAAKVAEAVDKAELYERAEGDDHHRVAVQLPGRNAFMYAGRDEAAATLAASMALGHEQAAEAARRLDARIREMVRAARRERMSAASWVHRF